MRIERLSDGMITSAIADRYVDPVSKKVYFNLAHGAKGPSTWKWYAGLSAKHFSSEDNCVILDGDNYNILPIYSKGDILRDKVGNICYNVVIDNDLAHHKDIILLWGIPTRGYRNLSYTIHGGVELIGEGKAGKSRGPNSVVGPAPVLEIIGDCELVWYGTDTSGAAVKQVAKYQYYDSKWSIGGVEKSGDTNV